VVLLVAAGGVGAGLLYQQRATAQARQDQTDQEVRGVLQRARGLLKEGWQAADLVKLTEAKAEGNRAVGISGSGEASTAVQQEAKAFRDEAGAKVGRAEKNRALLEAVLDVLVPQETDAYSYDEAGRLMVLAQPSVDEQYSAAFRRWGLDVDGTAEAEVVARFGAEPDLVVQELIAALDSWTLERRWQRRADPEWRRLFRLADRLDRSERHRRLRALLLEGSPPRAQSVAGLVGATSPWPALWELARGDTWRELLEVREKIDPRTEPVLTVVLLARAFAVVGDAAGAEQALRQAVAVLPDQVLLLHALGELLERQGPSRLEEAIGYYRAGRSRRRDLGVALSTALVRAGRPAEAEEVLQDLIHQRTDNPAFYFWLGTALAAQQKPGAAEAAYRKVIGLKPGYAEAHNNLGIALADQGKHGAAAEAYHKAIALKPELVQAHNNLGNALKGQGKRAEAEAAYHTAIALKTDCAEAYCNLGNALEGQGKRAEAEAVYRTAIALKPHLAEAHNNLAIALEGQGKHGEAEAACRTAIALKPHFAEAHSNLGIALVGQGKHGEAEAACRTALDLKPDFANADYNLGNALTAQGKHAEAAAAYRKAIDRRPELAEAHYNLGVALMRQQKPGEAEAAFRNAIERKPAFAEAYHNLGNALSAQRKHGEAEAAFQKVIDCKPDFPEAHHNLGMALMQQQKPGEAEGAFRKAIDLKPDFGLACHFLSLALLQQGRFDEAAAYANKAADLLPAQHPRRDPATQLQRQCQRYVTLDARLPAVLRGTERPADAAEQLEFAQLCLYKKAYGAAARFFGDAFTAEPKMAEVVPASTRYNAACAAALAGCGQAKDADALDDKERARCRRQAGDWLRQELTRLGKALDNGNAQMHAQVRQGLRHWQTDGDLAGVRAKDALAQLPDEERKQWETLWSDVDALLRRVSQPE
jgi:tetratricopeptide (TPR) repeat protein